MYYYMTYNMIYLRAIITYTFRYIKALLHSWAVHASVKLGECMQAA